MEYSDIRNTTQVLVCYRVWPAMRYDKMFYGATLGATKK
ncbi:hypothetical protein NPIL_689011, partial [Nephila pilipes]